MVYTLLVALFFVSAQLVGVRLAGEGSIQPLAALVAWLFFLHIRIFDEHKDFEKDAETYPDRVLSKGIITLGDLKRVGGVVLLLELAGVALMGPDAVFWWAMAFAFSLLMYVEFFVADWLNDHILLYAVSHNPVTALIAMFVWAGTGASWHPGMYWYLALASVGMLAFEIGRKTRLPDEEHPGVPSYTTELGQDVARFVLLGLYVAVACAVGGLVMALGGSPPVVGGLAVLCALPGAATAMGRQPAKRVEAGASVVLVLCFIVSAAAAWGLA